MQKPITKKEAVAKMNEIFSFYHNKKEMRSPFDTLEEIMRQENCGMFKAIEIAVFKK
jgi:hypothetical protein